MMRHNRTRSRFQADALEPRTLFAAPTLVALPNVTVYAGAPLQIPLDGFDADTADALTFTVTSNNANVAAAIAPSANRSLKISVAHTSSGATDPAFTGDMILKLFEDKAPVTTARIIQLANAGFYNGLSFHRVINDFMIQGGDPMGNGTGGSGTTFDDEFTPALQFTGRGLLAMAKSYDDTNDSQFFITESNPRYLDFNHTIFGQLVEGEATRDKVSNVPKDASDKPLGAVTMTSVSVIADKQNGVLSLSVPNNVTGGTATITVTAKDPANNTVSRTFTVTIAPDTTDNPPILQPIPNLNTRANTPVSVQLGSVDVEGTTPAYLNWVSLYNNFNGYVPVRIVPPDNLPPESATRDVDVNVNFDTGYTTVTPKNNVAGVFKIYLGVAQDRGAFDSQIVPLFVSPAAPTSIDLLPATDTGANTADNLTRLNNANAGAKLQFQVGGVLPGAVVSIYDGATLIGQATVAAGATTVVVTTNGSASLSNGVHNLTATQTLANLAWSVGNQSGTTNLASLASAALAVSIDTTAPSVTAPPTFNHAAATQPLAYLFGEDVSASLAAGDLTLVNLTTNTTVPAASIQLAWDAAAKKATFSFPGGLLADGNYRATLAAANVTDAAGNALAATSTFDFFVLATDANRDRVVDFTDLATLAQNYNTTGKTYAQGDFNLDGAVDFTDLAMLAQRYNTSLAAPAPAIEFSADTAGATSSVLTAEPTDDAAATPVFSTTPIRATAPRARPAGRR